MAAKVFNQGSRDNSLIAGKYAINILCSIKPEEEAPEKVWEGLDEVICEIMYALHCDLVEQSGIILEVNNTKK
jgi:hypothetical protein